MSQISKAVFGAIAVSLTLAAVQFASGHDLARGQQALNDTPVTIINRSAKTDRAASPAGLAEQTQTISLRPESLSDTSVLVRVPVTKKPETNARNSPAAPSLFKSGDRRKATVACEPMVSVLTEVAKQLQPGRCVT
jgi:hypothetical protein